MTDTWKIIPIEPSRMNAGTSFVVKGDDGSGGNVTIGYGVAIGDGVTVGHDVKIGDGVTIGNYARIGSNVKLGYGVVLGSKVVLGDSARIGYDVAIGYGVVLGSKVVLGNNARIGDSARIGDNARIGDCMKFGDNVRIGSNVKLNNARFVCADRDHRGYEFLAAYDYARKSWRILAGCRDFDFVTARRHWANNPEALRKLDYLDAEIASLSKEEN